MLRNPALAAMLLMAPAAVHGAPALELNDCRISAGPGFPSIDARCGTLTRPLDPADDSSESISLEVAVVPALTLDPAPDPFVPIAGGPGQSSLFFYGAYAAAFERVRQDRDILLVDQRGTGESAPMICDVDDDIVEGAYSEELTLRATEECLLELPYDPRYFTTSVAVADLEALREALSYTTLNLYGISYGTRVAQHFARQYPDSTRTIIIDGVVPPQLPLGPEIATESQLAIDRVLGRCRDDDACNERFPGIHGDFDELRATLRDASVTVALPNPVTAEVESIEFGDEQLGAAIRLLLYDPRTIALLPLLINDAANGNYAPLAAQYQMAVSTLSESLNIGMHNAIMCTEDLPFVDFATIDEGAIATSYLGPVQLEAMQTMCSIWPAGVLDSNLREPLATDKPVLLLSGGADPITPPRYAELAALKMTNKWLLLAEHQGHGLALVGCTPRLIGKFVADERLEDGDASCLDDAFTMPFFLDYSGPMP